MKLINPYFDSTLLEVVVQELASNRGERFDVGVGFAKNLTGATFDAFGNAVEKWLEGDSRRKFRIFIGDHRHQLDNKEQRINKTSECTQVAAKLIEHSPTLEERIEVIFVPRLHAKFYSMWSLFEESEHLEWAIIGSSNLTDAALREKNFELDIYFNSKDVKSSDIQQVLSRVINYAAADGDSSGELHDALDERTRLTRWENGKIRVAEEWRAEADAEWEAERQTEWQRAEEALAQSESDKRQGIFGAT